MNLARHRVPSHSARALAASERLSASVRFRAVTGRPSRQLPRLGCAIRVTSLCDEPRNLFDYIVGECQQRVGYRETYRFGGLKVDHQFEST